MLSEELTSTHNARDLAIEAFEGVNMKLAEALWRAEAELAARPILHHWDCDNTHSLEYQCGRRVELMRVELTRLEELRDSRPMPKSDDRRRP